MLTMVAFQYSDSSMFRHFNTHYADTPIFQQLYIYIYACINNFTSEMPNSNPNPDPRFELIGFGILWLEYWGVEYWGVRILGCWNIGVLEYWGVRILGCGILGC